MPSVVVIGGYLGAGKTTLVNHLLRHAEGRRIAVLVNDFGAISIDTALIEARDDQVLTLAGGCLCCSFGDDLVGVLQALAARDPAPDVVLIETSGVALPAAVARSARLARGVSVDAVVVLADAETLRERAADGYVGDTVREQLREADLLLLNKVELLPDAAARAALHGWLAEIAPQAPVVDCCEAVVAPDIVLGTRAWLPRPTSTVSVLAKAGGEAGDSACAADDAARLLRAPYPAAAVFDSCSLAFAVGAEGRAQAESMALALASADAGVLRAKARLVDTQGQGWTLQVVGRRWRVAPAAAGDGEPGQGRLVIVGLRRGLQAAAWPAHIDHAFGPAAAWPLAAG